MRFNRLNYSESQLRGSSAMRLRLGGRNDGGIYSSPLAAEFADGWSEANPDSEQIEPTRAELQRRNSGSVEQIQDRRGWHRVPGEGKKVGFTLAEVLITLGIIGVVAAMTLPTVINNTKNKQLETAFKKSYSALAQVTQQVILLDYGGQVPVNNVTNFSTMVNNFSKHYVNAKRCTWTTSINGCPLFDEETKTTYDFMKKNYMSYNGKINSNSIGNDALANTVDNTTIFFDYATEVEASHGQINIAIDVNGWNKKPNKWGHDIFMFYINKNGKLSPMGDEDSQWPADEYCSLTRINSSNGYGCTIKAFNEPDYFKNLPK